MNGEWTHFVVALAIGVLIGVERERRKGEGPGRAAAGLRTFALVGLAGAIAMAVGGGVAVAAGLLFVGAAALLGYLRSEEDDPGLTTEVALATVYLLGALAHEDPALAGALGVTTAVLLAFRTPIHHFVRSVLREDELHDLLLFAAAAAVVLPLLPDRSFGPGGVFNPAQAWRLVVFVMAVGGTGYVATRVFGARFGLPIAGLAGGFVSSAATIGAMGGLAKRQPELRRSATSGAVFSTVATVAQLVVVLGATSRPTLRELAFAIPLAGAGALLFGGVTAVAGFRSREEGSTPGRAFQLRSAATFAALLTGVTLAAALINERLGEAGAVLSAGAAGFADAHAAAGSAAALAASGELSPRAAALGVLAGLSTNTVTKIVVAYGSGGWPFTRRVVPGLVLVLGGAWAGAALRW